MVRKKKLGLISTQVSLKSPLKIDCIKICSKSKRNLHDYKEIVYLKQYFSHFKAILSLIFHHKIKTKLFRRRIIRCKFHVNRFEIVYISHIQA